MKVKGNFKIIEDTGEIKEVEQFITPEEENKIETKMSEFFSSVQTLLEEGAVFINENNEKESEEEKLLEDPYMKNHPLSLHILAFKMLPKEKAEYFLKKIQSIKMNEKYEVEIDAGDATQNASKVQKILSTQLKQYAENLPAIMEKRQEKLQMLIGANVEVKKYLEKIKKP